MDGHLLIQNATLILPDRVVEGDLRVSGAVSYTHLTLPTIYSV